MASPNNASFTLDLDEAAAVTVQPGTITAATTTTTTPTPTTTTTTATGEGLAEDAAAALELEAREQAKQEKWPFLACCSVCVSCADDSPLCCYALLCPMCLHTEMKMKLADDKRHCW